MSRPRDRQPSFGLVDREAATRCRREPAKLAYRIGTYSTFLRDLLDGIHTQEVAGESSDVVRPLQQLDVLGYHEWTIGLLKVWAEVGEILSFYQERIANEGYLTTATEARSLREIVRLIDHVPFPGVAASTHLSFNISDLPGTPEVVVIPERSAVTSAPERKELPQAWETVEQISARVEWNALKPKPVLTHHAQELAGTVDQVLLSGVGLGLSVGDPLLIEVSSEGASRATLHTTAAVAETPDAPGGSRPGGSGPRGSGTTRVTLDPPLASGDSKSPRRLLSVSTFDQSLQLFGHDAAAWSKLEDPVKAEYATPLGGVLRTGSDVGEWLSGSEGLPPGEATAILAAPDGSLFVGTESGIFRSADGVSWYRAGQDLVGQRIETLASDGQSQLYAGTAKSGVLRSSDGEAWETLLGESIRELPIPVGRRRPRSGRLPSSPVHAVRPSEVGLFAGTDHGVFVFVSEKDTWEAVNKGLAGYSPKTGRAGVSVRSFLPGSTPEELYIGTNKGVFLGTRSGRQWEGRNQGFPGYDAKKGTAKLTVLALVEVVDATTRTDLIIAGTDKGVFRTFDRGRTWEAASLGLPKTDETTGLSKTPVQALAHVVDPDRQVTTYYAATPHGLFVSTDAGIFWQAPPTDGVSSRPVSALSIGPDGTLLATVPVKGFDHDEWPGFAIRDGQLDLVGAGPGVAEGRCLVLIQDGDEDDEPRQALIRIQDAREETRRDFGLAGVVLRVTPAEPIQDPASFDLRRARVLAVPRRFEISLESTVLEPLPRYGFEIDVPPDCAPFEGSRAIVVTGKPLRATLSEPATLVSDDGQTHPIGPGETLSVLTRATPRSGRLSLRARRDDGTEGDVQADLTSLSWRRAQKDAEPLSERAVATWSTSESGTPELTLRPPLVSTFDPETVTVLGNIAAATQGRTIYQDVLGSGDAKKAHQRFRLSAPPLVYLQTGSARGWASTLEIRVSNALWRELPSLYDAGPMDHVYMIRHDAEGAATVVFGDGVHGARLPTGRENVVALYRSGMWTERVSRGRLSIAESKPLGLGSVSNPRTTTVGSPPERREQLRDRAAIDLRTLGRIVSLTDYEDFCRAYPGISKAKVMHLDTLSGALLQVTVATSSGGRIAAGDEFHRQLISSIDSARSEKLPCSVDFCRRTPFEVAARVRFEADRRARDVERAVRRELSRTFSYERSCFGERIAASGVVRLIGRIQGVVSVRLLALHRSGSTPEDDAPEAYLQAQPARWDASLRRVVPAELLELADTTKIRLQMVSER